MEFFELIKVRESCRKYSDKPVEPEKITKILEAARLAPSGCNSQPWHFTVNSVPVFVVVCEEQAKLLPMPEKKYGSQHFAQMDVGQAVAYLSLAAADIGLGTCMIGMFADDDVKKLVNAPRGSVVRMIVALGYPADESKLPRKKDRKDLSEIVTEHHR